jgi:hypothetical protein
VAFQVGTYNGVFVTYSMAGTSTNWVRLGSADEFPVTYAMQIRWQRSLDLLVVATLGRSVWTISNVSVVLQVHKGNNCPYYKTLAPNFAPGTVIFVNGVSCCLHSNALKIIICSSHFHVFLVFFFQTSVPVCGC